MESCKEMKAMTASNSTKVNARRPGAIARIRMASFLNSVAAFSTAIVRVRVPQGKVSEGFSFGPSYAIRDAFVETNE